MDTEQIGLEQHALLIAWLAQETVQRFGEKGRAAIREGVRRYGEERGRRMAARARAAGHALDLLSFLVFGEIDTSANTWKIVRTTPYFELHAKKCGWHDVWVKSNLIEAGGLYCHEIDDAILHGFNPNIQFQVDGTLSNGSSACRFLYYGWKINFFDKLRLAWYQQQAGDRYKRPFSFHILHYYRTLSGALDEAFGAQGRMICATCADRFFDHVGVSLRDIEAAWGGEL